MRDGIVCTAAARLRAHTRCAAKELEECVQACKQEQALPGRSPDPLTRVLNAYALFSPAARQIIVFKEKTSENKSLKKNALVKRKPRAKSRRKQIRYLHTDGVHSVKRGYGCFCVACPVFLFVFFFLFLRALLG